MIRVLRHVREVSDEQKLTQSKPLDEFRDTPAWVLLGEPGAGKSTTFEAEAKETGGKYLRIAEFLELDLDDDDRGKTLFLDGLDEVRAGGDNTLLKIRNKLKKLGNPPFRISCRAADWYGTTDQSDIAAAAADGKITVLLLEPLADDDILCILRANHGVQNPENFVKEAQKRGIDGLLNNPQTLGLLAKAVRDKQFPATRQETYLLACREMAAEANKIHRDKKRGNDIAVEARLDAAGHLCAVLLFANHTGIALDSTRVEESFFVEIEICQPPDSNAAYAATGSKLFRPAAAEERVEPAHRTIAEFLAARWLGQQIDQHGLPLKRVLNLLLGRDGRTVAGLRGLYAWLAVECLSARKQLIDADPITVLMYGDVGCMGKQEDVWKGVKRDLAQFEALHFHTEGLRLGDLATPELSAQFQEILIAKDCSSTGLLLMWLVLTILAEGKVLPELKPVVKDALLGLLKVRQKILGAKEIMLDATEVIPPTHLLEEALRAWCNLGATNEEIAQLLAEIADDKIADPNGVFTEILLRELPFQNFSPEEVLKYLQGNNRPPVGIFLDYLAETSEENVQRLLALFSDKSTLFQPVVSNSLVRGLLLQRGVELCGDKADGEKLFAWLELALGKDNAMILSPENVKVIDRWLRQHPEHCEALLEFCYRAENPHCRLAKLFLYLRRNNAISLVEECPSISAFKFLSVSTKGYMMGFPFEGFGLCLIQQATKTKDVEIIQDLLRCCARILFDGSLGSEGLSVNLLEEWGKEHPVHQEYVRSLIAKEQQNNLAKQQNENLRTQQIQEKFRQYQEKDRQETFARKSEASAKIFQAESAIRAGNSDHLTELAKIWFGDSSDQRAPLERFNEGFEYGEKVLALAEEGFRACIKRDDLPEVDDIVAMAWPKTYPIQNAILVGMALLWHEDKGRFATLPKNTLRTAVAFYFSSRNFSQLDWLAALCTKDAKLVAEVYAAYVLAQLQSPKSCIGLSLTDFLRDHKNVAVKALPEILGKLPLRSSDEPGLLSRLLKIALSLNVSSLDEIVKLKSEADGWSELQKAHWVLFAMLLDPDNYESNFQQCYQKSGLSKEAMNQAFAEFLDAKLPIYSSLRGKVVSVLGRIIEEIDASSAGNFVVHLEGSRSIDWDQVVGFLVELAPIEAEREMTRLLELSVSDKLKGNLQKALPELQAKLREQSFQFPPPKDVAQVLANKAPISSADLAALALDYLDEIANRIRTDGDDGFNAFWNIETVEDKDTKKKVEERKHRSENLCRNALLTRLDMSFKPFGVRCDREGDYVENKRADIRLTSQRFELPIEVKGEWHEKLKTAAQSQLVQQYAIDPDAKGYGIYLVLWFGGKDMPSFKKSDSKPSTPEALQEILEAEFKTVSPQRIFVRVLDVTPPSGLAP